MAALHRKLKIALGLAIVLGLALVFVIVEYYSPSKTNEHVAGLIESRGGIVVSYTITPYFLAWTPDFFQKAMFNRIVYVNLSSCNINHDVLREISFCQDIKSLYLQDTAVGDNDIEPIRNLENLKTLDLSNTQVTSQSIDTLKNLSILKKLDISLTPMSRQILEQKYPDGFNENDLDTYLRQLPVSEIEQRLKSYLPRTDITVWGR